MNRFDTQVLPESRSDDLLTRKIPGELLVYDRRRHKAFCLNETAAMIWELCDGKRTAADLLAELQRGHRSGIDQRVVWLGLDLLSRANLLKQRVTRPAGLQTVTRRHLIRAGIVAATVPVVTMIVAPTAQAAASTITRAECRTLSNTTCPGIPCSDRPGNCLPSGIRCDCK
jgi:Coenzyme PQQ synthesis protein D (PqqD)